MKNHVCSDSPFLSRKKEKKISYILYLWLQIDTFKTALTKFSRFNYGSLIISIRKENWLNQNFIILKSKIELDGVYSFWIFWYKFPDLFNALQWQTLQFSFVHRQNKLSRKVWERAFSCVKLFETYFIKRLFLYFWNLKTHIHTQRERTECL